VQHAAFLLAGTEQPIAAIGARVGWPEPATFSHQFRRIQGTSPREYRRRANAGRPAGDRPHPDEPAAST
jgi:AraC family L-rhamnose operon transcriptional activator RhaR